MTSDGDVTTHTDVEQTDDQTVKKDSLLTNDERLAEAIEDALAAEAWTQKFPVTVAVVGSTVTLTGHVPNQHAKDSAIALARGVHGVIDVDDDLVIGGDHPWKNMFMPWRNRDEDIEGGSGEF
jgi:osmotically-inducible protein OsmY